MFAGSTDRPVLPVGCCDANAKANRYKKAGTAVGASSSASQPRRYFAAAHDKVVQFRDACAEVRAIRGACR